MLSTHNTHALRPSAHHVSALDGVRGIALIAVLADHFQSFLPDKLPLIRSMKVFLGLGWTGVDLFFVLSGFLITGILIDTRGRNSFFSSFYARRLLRIFPLYYTVLLILTLSASIWQHIGSPLPGNLTPYFFYLNNWTDTRVPLSHLQVTGHFWSLAVEEQFYLLWPLLTWIVPKQNLWQFCAAGVLSALLLRCLLVLALVTPRSGL